MVSKICAPVLLNLLNLLRKIYNLLGKPHILSLFLNTLNKFNKILLLSDLGVLKFTNRSKVIISF